MTPRSDFQPGARPDYVLGIKLDMSQMLYKASVLIPQRLTLRVSAAFQNFGMKCRIPSLVGEFDQIEHVPWHLRGRFIRRRQEAPQPHNSRRLLLL